MNEIELNTGLNVTDEFCNRVLDTPIGPEKIRDYIRGGTVAAGWEKTDIIKAILAAALDHHQALPTGERRQGRIWREPLKNDPAALQAQLAMAMMQPADYMASHFENLNSPGWTRPQPGPLALPKATGTKPTPGKPHWELTREERRAAITAAGQDPDLPPRGVPSGTPPPGLRNWVCAADGHSDPDNGGPCIYCGASMAAPEGEADGP